MTAHILTLHGVFFQMVSAQCYITKNSLDMVLHYGQRLCLSIVRALQWYSNKTRLTRTSNKT